MNKIKAFTIIEILVASSLFVSLMGIAAFSFQRLSEGGRYAQRVIALHERGDAIIRLLEKDIRTLQQTTALQLQETTLPHSFTFMRQSVHQEDRMQHVGHTVSGLTGIGQEGVQPADMIWVKWQWENGTFSRGQSRDRYSNQWNNRKRFTSETQELIKTVQFNYNTSAERGIHANGIPPTPQRYFVNFYGNGTFRTVASDGSVNAGSGDQIRVYTDVDDSDYVNNECNFFDNLNSPWRINQDYNHWYTTCLVGNDNQLSVNAFAVCNDDGKTFNKDRINLEGTDDNDGNGNYYYPGMVKALFSGTEFFDVELVKLNGAVISNADDDDTIADGNASIDINGHDPMATSIGSDKRPVAARISFLLHSVDLNELDDSDYDGDGDTDEYLVKALRDAVEDENNATRVDDIKSFKNHCQIMGGASVFVQYSIKLSL